MWLLHSPYWRFYGEACIATLLDPYPFNARVFISDDQTWGSWFSRVQWVFHTHSECDFDKTLTLGASTVHEVTMFRKWGVQRLWCLSLPSFKFLGYGILEAYRHILQRLFHSIWVLAVGSTQQRVSVCVQPCLSQFCEFSSKEFLLMVAILHDCYCAVQHARLLCNTKQRTRNYWKTRMLLQEMQDFQKQIFRGLLVMRTVSCLLQAKIAS